MTISLSYVIADFDAEDTYSFQVGGAAAALEVGWLGENETVGKDVLAAAKGVWVLQQESASPEARDASWAPPFLVSHAVRDALARDGECTLYPGFAPDRPVSLARVEPDSLSDETRGVLSKWKGKVLCARSDEGDELVVANAATPQLLAFRTDDVCTITWSSGVLDGATKKAPAPKKKPAAGKKKSSADVLAAIDAPIADRMKAAKALGKSATLGAIEALGAHLADPDATLGPEVRSQFNRACYAWRHAGNAYDVFPLFQRIVASSPERPLPAPAEGDFDPVSGALGQLLNFLGSDERDEVSVALRSLAWESLRGGVSSFARILLVSRGDADAIERVSQMLADTRVSSAAARALVALPTAVGIERAKAQIDALEGAPRAAAAWSLFSAVEHGPESFDRRAWFELLRSEIHTATPVARERLAEWAARELDHMGPPSEQLLVFVATAHRAWRDDDLAAKFAAYPPSVLTAPILREVLRVTDLDVSAVLAAADLDELVRALSRAIEEDPSFVPTVGACLALASRKAAALRPLLEELAKRHEAWSADDARAIRDAL